MTSWKTLSATLFSLLTPIIGAADCGKHQWHNKRNTCPPQGECYGYFQPKWRPWCEPAPLPPGIITAPHTLLELPQPAAEPIALPQPAPAAKPLPPIVPPAQPTPPAKPMSGSPHTPRPIRSLIVPVAPPSVGRVDSTVLLGVPMGDDTEASEKLMTVKRTPAAGMIGLTALRLSK